MTDLKNNEITEIISKIQDDSGNTIPVNLLRELADNLNNCEVYCPVKDGEIILYDWGPRKFIPASCSLDDFEKIFKDETPEIFEFKQLKEFITKDIYGIFLNPGDKPFIVNRYLAKLIFNKNRPKTPTSKGYDVKVRLNDFRPLTWRDMIIPDNISFMELDDALKTIWGFNGHHLSCFLIRKDNLIITDEDLASETMMGCDFEANTTLVSEVFDKYNKVTYWYDFGDDWQFDIEIKNKIDYTKDYITMKRFKGKYNPVEDCGGVYGLSEIIYYAEHPEKADSSYSCELVDYLDEFDMELCQFELENKAYTKSNWHKSVYFGDEF